jgi:type VI protein secretion system component VasF
MRAPGTRRTVSAPARVAASESAMAVQDLPLHRQLVFYGFAALMVLAVVFYVWWGLSYRVWFDNGVYAVVITLLLFGLAGMWLMMPNPPAPAPPPERA